MNNNQKKACALVRVSSEEQAKGGYGLEFQERDIRTFCARNDLNLIHVFRDEGYSGATAERPGFQQVMQWAREKQFDILVVWKLDRLFRDTRLTLQTVDELADLSIDVRSVQETFTHDSNGRFLLTIFAAGAEKERKDIALRTAAGRMAAARNGVWINGGTAAYGYRYDPLKKRLAIQPREARIVRRMFAWLIDEKLSLYKIQQKVNELHIPTKFDSISRRKPSGSTHWWATRTIGRILTNEVYTGKFTFRKFKTLGAVRTEQKQRGEDEWITVQTPRIIPHATFQKAQAQLRANSLNSPRRTKELYLLRGLLICGHDHRRMQAARRLAGRNRQCKYYFCNGIRKSATSVRCTSRAVSESRIAPPVWSKLVDLLLRPESVLRELQEYSNNSTERLDIERRAASLEQRQKAFLGRKSRLTELFLAGSVDRGFFDTELARLLGELDRLQRERERLHGLTVSNDELQARARNLQQIHATLGSKLANASPAVQ
ncbi:MAG: recombinase family protein, partial [Terriglobales bacterium]